jgi:hypothetical protein
MDSEVEDLNPKSVQLIDTENIIKEDSTVK